MHVNVWYHCAKFAQQVGPEVRTFSSCLPRYKDVEVPVTQHRQVPVTKEVQVPVPVPQVQYQDVPFADRA